MVNIPKRKIFVCCRLGFKALPENVLRKILKQFSTRGDNIKRKPHGKTSVEDLLSAALMSNCYSFLELPADEREAKFGVYATQIMNLLVYPYAIPRKAKATVEELKEVFNKNFDREGNPLNSSVDDSSSSTTPKNDETLVSTPTGVKTAKLPRVSTQRKKESSQSLLSKISKLNLDEVARMV